MVRYRTVRAATLFAIRPRGRLFAMSGRARCPSMSQEQGTTDMPIWKPRTFSDAEVLEAARIVKAERPDLWDCWLEHERNDEGYRDIGDELLRLVFRHNPSFVGHDTGQMLSQVRRLVRMAAGRPI
jgi:hypothetical protein